MKKVLVNGAGGFIGGHLVKRLKDEGFWVRGVDIKEHEFSNIPADEFIKGDLCDLEVAKVAVDGIEEVYQLAADMGGAGYIFTGDKMAIQINVWIMVVSVHKEVVPFPFMNQIFGIW